jgi:hypothetical protein
VLQDLIPEDEETSIHDNWTKIKETLNQTCEKIQERQKRHKEWISAERYRKIEDRKEKKAAVNQCRTRGSKAIAEEQYMLANRKV